MAAVDEKVKQIIVEQLQVDEAEVTPGASFQEDLGALGYGGRQLDFLQGLPAFNDGPGAHVVSPPLRSADG